MRKLLIGFLAFALMYSCTTEPQYTIKVKVEGAESGIAYLKDRGDVLDSTLIENGEFTFKGSVEMPEHRIIEYSDAADPIELFVDNTEVNVVIAADQEIPVITGGMANEKFSKYNILVSEFYAKRGELYNEYTAAQIANEEEKIKDLEEQFNYLYEDYDANIEAFVAENTNCVVGAYVAYRQLVYQLDVNGLDSLLQTFDPTVEPSKYIAQMKEFLEAMKKVDIGQPYTDITQADPEGNMVSLSSFIGNGYVLIDFWASWCNPCREENPNLVANYEKYHDKGFEIFGVSFDAKKESWEKGINDDGITWPQVSDLQGWGNAAGKLYAIRSIPQNVLVDKDGIIIAKNLRGEDLGAKLEELLGE